MSNYCCLTGRAGGSPNGLGERLSKAESPESLASFKIIICPITRELAIAAQLLIEFLLTASENWREELCVKSPWGNRCGSSPKDL